MAFNDFKSLGYFFFKKKINRDWFPCRSLGTAGQPGDAASGRCGPCGDRGLLDDHPAAAVALRRAAAQRTAPGLAPEDLGGVKMALIPCQPSAHTVCAPGWW